MIQTEQVEGCTIEAGPDSFLSVKPAALELIRELGLRDHVIGSNDHLRMTYVRKNGTPGAAARRPDDDGAHQDPAAGRPPACSARAPRSAWAWNSCARPKRRPGDESVADFVREHYGQEAVDYLAEPLLCGIYGGDPRELSVTARAAALRGTRHQVRQPHARRAGLARQAAKRRSRRRRCSAR